ncbi:MAG: hypothetical protein ABSG01_08960 [Anaerolineales bacterium]|jgi:hypothetical protein
MTTSIEWRQKRAAKIAEARALVDKADGENRDFSVEERTQYVALMGEDNQSGEIGKLAKTIQEREALEKLEKELPEPTSPALRPEGKKNPKLMKRSEFDALDAQDRAKYMHEGGALED